MTADGQGRQERARDCENSATPPSFAIGGEKREVLWARSQTHTHTYIAKTMSSLDYKEDARDLHAFKELRFFLSHSVPLEIRCGVARLELPLVADYLLGGGGGDGDIGGGHADYGHNNNQQPRQQQQQKKRHQQKLHGLAPEVAAAGTADDGGEIARIVSRIVAEPELVATCQLFSDGQPMHKVAMRYCTRRRPFPRGRSRIGRDRQIGRALRSALFHEPPNVVAKTSVNQTSF